MSRVSLNVYSDAIYVADGLVIIISSGAEPLHSSDAATDLKNIDLFKRFSYETQQLSFRSRVTVFTAHLFGDHK
jgi:hypothetical protein